MINNWSELFQEFKTWWYTPITFKRKPKLPEPSEYKDILSKPSYNYKNISDSMMEAEKQRLRYNQFYGDFSYPRTRSYEPGQLADPWQDQIEQEVNDAEGRLQTESDPVKREARRQELIKKIKAKYGLDHS